ncbi:6-aminohexanoate hydrolase [Bradyrhizobium nanningense]|uniref:Indoleacetamide hydrolase n=1 Tax=Bradyrhizobium nanningense TaxID=1325118 RepID=A0A4Q0SFG3_9BRAD|nr:amidase [Bradyrhizobium nanningense]RXH37927.1 6-aminohexanoate hydrolase [Bradyrhizobium nanningense]
MTGFSEFGDYDALGLGALVHKGEVSPTELLEEAIGRLNAVDPKLNAVPIRHDDFARQQIEAGLPKGPFCGVPFLLKDQTLLAGTQTSFGSRAYKGFVPDHSSTFVERCLNAGFTMFGKTATPEYSLDYTTEPVAYGPTCNPWNLGHSAGGSSGGAAAVVAARVLPLAHATDGGGSIRIPAACCGVFGLKPTRARTPQGPDRLEGWGSMSCAHALSLSVRDSAALLDVTQGPELGSPYGLPPPERPYLDEVGRDPGRLRIAFVDRHLDGSAIDEEIATATRTTASLLERLGHFVEEKAPPRLSADRSDVSRAIVYPEIAASLKRRSAELGRPLNTDDFETGTLAEMEIGNGMTALEYIAATQAMRQIGRDLALFFVDFDVLLTPTLCLPPLRLGQLEMKGRDLDAYYRIAGRYAPWTGMFNMSGQPSMSVPLAWSKDGLPLGMLFSGRFGDEATLFRLAAQLEQARPWRRKRPPVAAG